MISRIPSADTSYTSQSTPAMALTREGPPVRWATSPVNSPRPRTARTFGVSLDSSTISIWPALTTKNLKSRAPTEISFSPAR